MTRLIHSFGLAVILLTLMTSVVAAGPPKSRPRKQNLYEAQEKKLYDFLMRDHNPNVRPVVDQGNVTTIYIGADLLQILELNAEEEFMRTSLILRLEWQDDFLMWNPSDFDNLHSIMVPKSKVWMPDFTFINALPSGGCDEREVHAVVSSEGRIKMNIPMNLKTPCTFDLEYYPRDTQVCQLILASVTTNTAQVEMDFLVEGESQRMSLINFHMSAKWSILDAPQKLNRFYNNIDKIHVDEMQWSLRVKRRASSESWWMATHLGFLALLPPFIFAVRHKEKPMAGLVLTLITAVSVLFLEPKFPKSTLSHSDIARVAMGLFGIACIVTILATLTQRLARIQRPPPRFIKAILLDVCGKLVCVRSGVETGARHGSGGGGVNMNSLDSDSNKGDAESETVMTSGGEGSGDWCQIATVLDRFLFIVFSVIAAGIVITVWSAHSQ